MFDTRYERRHSHTKKRCYRKNRCKKYGGTAGYNRHVGMRWNPSGMQTAIQNNPQTGYKSEYWAPIWFVAGAAAVVLLVVLIKLLIGR